MKNIKVEVKQELFEDIGVQIGQISCTLCEDNSFRLCGAVRAEECLDDCLLYIKANLCDEANNVLYVVSTFEGIGFDITKFDGFSIFCTQLSRSIDTSKLHHVEVYPTVKKK